MNEFLTVFRYTFLENIRKKTIIISTCVVLLITVVLMLVPSFMSESTPPAGEEPTKTGSGTIYVQDSTGILAQAPKDLNGYALKLINPGEVEAIKKDIGASNENGLVIISKANGVPTFTYFVKSWGKSLEPENLVKLISDTYNKKLLKDYGANPELLEKLVNDVPFTVNETGSGLIGGTVSCIIVMLLMFFAIYMYSYGVATSVSSEKSSRVMELLVTSAKPRNIVLGKSAGMGLVGLIQYGLVLLTASLMYIFFFPKDFALGGMRIDFSSFTPVAIMMIFVYFLLGYTLYSMMNAVVGASVSKSEDLQSAIMPISLISLISFYLAYGAFGFPDSKFAVAATIIPFSAPFSLPARMLVTNVPIWQIALSLVLLIATIVLITTFSIRLYSSAVLHYGKKLKISELFKISKNT